MLQQVNSSILVIEIKVNREITVVYKKFSFLILIIMSIFEGLVEVMVKDIVILIFISRNISNTIGFVTISVSFTWKK